MRFKVGDWVYRFIGNYQNPFLCEVVGFGEIDTGILKTKMEPRYILQVPKQEWKIYGSDNTYDGNYCAKTVMELFNRG